MKKVPVDLNQNWQVELKSSQLEGYNLYFIILFILINVQNKDTCLIDHHSKFVHKYVDNLIKLLFSLYN